MSRLLCCHIKNYSFITSLLEKKILVPEHGGDCRLIRNSEFTVAEFHRGDVIRKACKAVWSVSESCFDIRFNPDACSTGNLDFT